MTYSVHGVLRLISWQDWRCKYLLRICTGVRFKLVTTEISADRYHPRLQCRRGRGLYISVYRVEDCDDD